MPQRTPQWRVSPMLLNCVPIEIAMPVRVNFMSEMGYAREATAAHASGLLLHSA